MGEDDQAAGPGLDSENQKGGQVYARIRELLLLNRLPPGAQINIGEMAEELGVSTTPVREALIRLSVEGVVTAVANKGFYAKPLDARELLAEYELALVVLSYAIRRNIAAFSLDGLEAPPEVSADDGARVESPPENILRSHADYLSALFERIAALSSNASVVEVIRQFNDRTRYIRELDLQSSPRLLQVARNVSDLTQHLEAGDIEAADASIRRQFESSVANLYELVKEGNARALSQLF